MSKWRDYLEPGDEVDLADFPEPGDDPDVPKAMGVLFGAQVGWSPGREGQQPGSCTICGNGHPNTPIQPGSRHYCAGCGRYGLDTQIVSLLKEHPAPMPDAPVKQAGPVDTPRPIPPLRGKISVPERYTHLVEKG